MCVVRRSCFRATSSCSRLVTPTPFLLAAAIFPAVTRQGHCSARSRGLTPSSASSYREAENSPRAIRIIWGSEVTRWSDVQGRYARVARSTCAGHDRLTAGMYVVLEQERELGRSSHALTYLFRVLGQSVVHLDGFLDQVLVGDLEEREADDLGHFDRLFLWLECKFSRRLYGRDYWTSGYLIYEAAQDVILPLTVGLPVGGEPYETSTSTSVPLRFAQCRWIES